MGQLKYFFTNHARQRRQHHVIRPISELKGIMYRLNAIYDFAPLNDGKYFFRWKEKSAVFKKDGKKITLITIRGIHLTTELSVEVLPILIKEDPDYAEAKADRKAERAKKHAKMLLREE